MKKLSVGSLIISILTAELVGVLSGLLSGNFKEVYQMIDQPPLSPPGWAFPIVWTVLYALMGTAAYLITRTLADSKQKQDALLFYAVQLLVNFLWSIVFFRFEQFGISVAVILLLDILVLITIVKFFQINKIAAYLLIPYFLWILFATYLNIGVYLLN